MRAWDRPASVLKDLNMMIMIDNANLQSQIKNDVARHNAIWRRMTQVSRRFKEEYDAQKRAELTTDEEVLQDLGLTREPVLGDYITADKRREIAQQIHDRQEEIKAPPRKIGVQDIPVSVNKNSCTWKENDWFPLTTIHAIYDKVLQLTHMMKAKVHESHIEAIKPYISSHSVPGTAITA